MNNETSKYSEDKEVMRHPENEILAAFCDQTLEQGKRDRIEEHLSNCSRCLDIVEAAMLQVGVESSGSISPDSSKKIIELVALRKRRVKILPLALSASAAVVIAVVSLVIVANLYHQQGTRTPEKEVRTSKPIELAQLTEWHKASYIASSDILVKHTASAESLSRPAHATESSRPESSKLIEHLNAKPIVILTAQSKLAEIEKTLGKRLFAPENIPAGFGLVEVQERLNNQFQLFFAGFQGKLIKTFSIFLKHSEENDTSKIEKETFRDNTGLEYTIIHFRANQFYYALISPILGESELRKIARSIQK